MSQRFSDFKVNFKVMQGDQIASLKKRSKREVNCQQPLKAEIARISSRKKFSSEIARHISW